MAYTYSLVVNGTDYNLAEFVDSSTLSIVKPFCSKSKKSGKGTMSVTIKGAANKTAYRSFMQDLLIHATQTKQVNDCPLRVSCDGTVVFSGYLDKSCIDIKSKKIPEWLVLAGIDKSHLLDRKIRINRYWENQSRNTIISDLFSALSTECGLSLSVASSEIPNTEVVGNFCVTESKEQTYRDVIDTIIFEAIGYVLFFDPASDAFRIKSIPTSVSGLSPREVTFLIENGLVSRSVIYDNDGILLSYPTIVERANTNVYAENINLSFDENNRVIGDTVIPGEYFPHDADVKEIYQTFRLADRPYVSGESRVENQDLSLLYAKNVTVSIQANPALTLAPALPNVHWDGTVEIYPDKARAIYVNNAVGENSNVTVFGYTATAVYIDYYNKITYPKACANPQEYKVQTITDPNKAKAFANWLYNSNNYGASTSQWSEYNSSAYLGEVVNVIHKDTGVQMPHVIVQITDESIDGSRVRKSNIVAISIYSWSAYDPALASEQQGYSEGANSSVLRLISTNQQYYISESKDELIGGTWLDEMPSTYTGYVWYRTKYIYSNGTVTYSQYAHYLTTAEIDAPWVLTTFYAVSSSNDWEQADTTQPPVQGVTYYERLLDGSLKEADVSDGWVTGISYYFIPDCTAWGNSIPSSWRHGLYVWTRDNINYTLNGTTQRMTPVFSASATSDAEKTCKFVVTPSSYTWAKNKRAVDSDSVIVTFGYEIQGYGESVEPLITVPSGYDIETDNNSIKFNSAITLDRMEIFVSLAQFPDVTPVKIVLESVDVTDEPTYLGILSAMPSADNTRFSRFLAGDHFVANGITDKTDLMPYVYDGVNWVTPSRNGVYGPMTYIQILYNCVHDIFSNAQDVYTLCGTGATAQEGVSYYQQIDGVWTGVVVRTGEDVSTLYTKGTNIPSQVLEYYNYQAEIISDYVASNDIQLVEQTDPVTGKTKVGKIRSAGYEKGTVKKLIETAQGGQSLASYKQGFYGDTDGNFEAFDAWLYRANIYNANIVGELRNDLFFTNLEAKVGATYTQSTLTNESWSGTKALESVRTAIGSGNVEKVLSMGAHYPTQGNQYSLGMLVDNPARAVEASVNAGATFTSPIFTAFTASLPLFNSSNVPVSGGDIFYNGTLVNRKRWAISSLYENTDITENVLNASGISWNGTNMGYARVTNPEATAVGATSQGTVQSWSWRYTWQTINIPSWYKNATISMTLHRTETSNAFHRHWSQSQIYVNINGERVFTQGITRDGSNVLYRSFTVKGGDVVSVYFGGDTEYSTNTEHTPGWAWSIAAQTFSAIGFTEAGFYTFSQTTGYDGNHVYASDITNRSNHSIYYQENTTDSYYEKATVTLSSPSWSSENHLLSSTLSYTYEKYQTGLNLLNSNGERQQTITTGAHPVSEYFDIIYGGTERYRSTTAEHYWHINSAGILKTGGSPVDSGKIFAIDSCTAYYKLFGDNSRRNITGVTGVIWTNTSIIFETSNGNVIVTTSDWVEEFYVNLVSQSQRRGNFADTILPIMGEEDRKKQDPVKEINLGSEENRFDEGYLKRLGSGNVPTEIVYTENLGQLVSVPGSSIASFEPSLVYYEYDSAKDEYIATTDSTPNSSKTYYNVYSVTDAYVKNQWTVTPEKISKNAGGGRIPGTVFWYAGSANDIPEGTLLCNGATVLIADYQNLFDAIGTTFGGNGTTNFKLPDFFHATDPDNSTVSTGLFIRATDGSSLGAVGSKQYDAIRNITGTIRTYHDTSSNYAFPTGALYAASGRTKGNDNAWNTSWDIGLDASRVVPTGTDNHPYNMKLLPLIVY